MRILLIEDDHKIAQFVKSGLQQAGFVVTHVDNGLDGLYQGLTGSYDAAVVDVMLPDKDGISVIQELREQNVNLPVLILSARRSVDERVAGLTAGGDDYLTKPFVFSELLARVQALVRRSPCLPTTPELVLADLKINLNSRVVTRAGREIELQRLEFSLLEYLMRNKGRIVSKTMIMEQVWDYSFNPQTNVVESRICCLRDKIDRNIKPKLIHTVRGVGYVLRENPAS